MSQPSGARKFGVLTSVVVTALLGVLPATSAVTSATAAAPTLAAAPTPAAAAADPVWPSPAPMQHPSSDVVTADVMPTVQLDDGVVWSTAIVGNTVYAGGKFSNARPYGAAKGTNLQPRQNLLAFDITTGVLNTSFAPTIDGQVRAVAKSPDGTRLYIAGDFGTVNGQSRVRIAAFSTATGQLISTFRPALSGGFVTSLAVTNTTVYAGGLFSSAAGVARKNLAAVDAVTGAVRAWAPTTDMQADALTMTPDNSKVIVGGRFGLVNGAVRRGLAAIDATTGSVVPWTAQNVIVNGMNSGEYRGMAGIWSLYSDGVSVFGSGWAYAPPSAGNLEGMFSADPTTGAINWIESCHGDSYQMWSDTKTVYTTSHEHACAHMGGFPESDPRTTNTKRATAFTADRKGTIANDLIAGGGYTNWQGQPSPGMLNWFPDAATGKFTGQGQAGWTMNGNAQYLVMGGEFPTVNGQAQYGLVRFGKPAVSQHLEKPKFIGSNFLPTLVPLDSTTARVSWLTNVDRDDLNLVYKVYRDNNVTTPVYTVTAPSVFWNRMSIGFVDKGLTPGKTYQYKVYASDDDGNVTPGSNVSITMPANGGGSSAYAAEVTQDGASPFWRLGEPSGTAAYDNTGFNDGIVGAGVTRSAGSAIIGDSNTSTHFNGAADSAVGASQSVTSPDTFTVSSWFRTTSTSGGKIVGFGNSRTGNSGSYDRHVYMDNAGRIWFGVHPGAVRTINSGAAYNDGQWHQVVASLGSDGMTLWIDGVRVAKRSDVTGGQDYTGYWRAGGDNTGGWTSAPSNNYFTGDIDEVAIFPTVLSRASVEAQYTASGRSLPTSSITDPYGSSVVEDYPQLYWRLAEASGTTASDSGPSGTTAVYSGGVTLGEPGVIDGNTAARFDGASGAAISQTPVSNPTTYSAEAWFKTTTDRGGKIIGFGTAKAGLSSNYDRHIYMQDNGALVFGTYTGTTNTITTPTAFNDGQWHHVVGTQASTGMAFYVDGALIGSNTVSGAESYTGYWRIGGDTTWGSSSAYFAGTIDEAAVYSDALTQAQVSRHYSIGSTGTPPNAVPTASFTSAPAGLTAAFDSSASTDSDGTIASYSWNFGDDTAAGTGATTSHRYAAAGTYQVTLTVTDNAGGTGTVTRPVTVTHADPVPTFTSGSTALAATFAGSATTSDAATIASYSWDFGDDTPAGAGANASHTYAASGTYQVTLTVTDSVGSTGTVSEPVTVQAANVAPTAAFTSSTSVLSVTFDGSTSADQDGTIASYGWDFGDNTAVGTGVSPSHTYATGGTYQVKLTVTDDKGATGTRTVAVTVTAPVTQVVASDGFGRTAANSWGSAETGGAYTITGVASNYAVSGGTGRMIVGTGVTRTATLATVNARDVDATFDVSIDKAATGGGVQVLGVARKTSAGEYRIRLVLNASGQVINSITRLAGGTETGIAANAVVPGVTPADTLRVRLQVTGQGSTTIQSKVWKASGAEPSAWTRTVVDTTAALQVPGAFGLSSYVSGSSTAVPVTVSFDSLSVTRTAAN